MKAAPAKPGASTPARWLLALLAVMAVQVGAIFALGERTPPKPRAITVVQSLRLSDKRSEFQELVDPTIFSRPHARDFSAGRWLIPTAPVFPSFRWTEPTRPLGLSVEQFGEVLHQFMQTNLFAAFLLEARPAPELLASQREEIVEAVPRQSRLTIRGGLAGRKLLNPPALPAQPADDLLTNSVVQVHVDSAGHVLSAVLLGAERVGGGSGSAQADSAALDMSRGLRFAPVGETGWLANPVAQITRGLLIFEWRTEANTNGAASLPKSP